MTTDAPAKHFCDACREYDHFLCTEGDCACGCNVEDGKLWGMGRWRGYRANGYDEQPKAGTKARRNWIGRQASAVEPGEYHLHALYNRGRVMWVVTGKGSPLCKQPGRCQRVVIARS